VGAAGHERSQKQDLVIGASIRIEVKHRLRPAIDRVRQNAVIRRPRTVDRDLSANELERVVVIGGAVVMIVGAVSSRLGAVALTGADIVELVRRRAGGCVVHGRVHTAT
jgi:hypothetical protein